MKIDNKVFLDLFRRKPKEGNKYIIIVSDSILHERLWSIGYYSMLISDAESAENAKSLIYDALIKKGLNVKDYVFLAAYMKDRAINDELNNAFGSYGIKYDVQAYKIFYKKNFALADDKTIKQWINVYIKNIENNNEATVFESPINAVDLQSENIKPIEWIVYRLITSGESLLTAPSKFGKSWFGMDLAISVAEGTPFLGRVTQTAPVLYLALEDSKRRLQRRMNKLLAGKKAPENLYFLTKAPTLDNGLIETLEQEIKSKNLKLIIIDTFQKVRGISNGKNPYATDYADMGKLKELADKHDIAILLIHHNRKMKDDDDVFNQISGTNGIMGAADTIIVLTKNKRDDKEIKMHLTGRDVEQNVFVLNFDKETCRFKLIGSEQTLEEQEADFYYRHNEIVITIKALLSEHCEGWQGTASQIQSEMMKRHIGYIDERLIGKRLKELAQDLYEKDNIVYSKPSNSRTRIHKFSYAPVVDILNFNATHATDAINATHATVATNNIK